MAIIPVKNNYEESLSGQGMPHLSATAVKDPWTTVTAAGTMIARAGGALMTAQRRSDAIAAQAKANEFGIFLDQQQQMLSERKGLNAYQDDDGNPMFKTINKNVSDKISEMTAGMSGQQKFFFMHSISGFNRSFNSGVSSYIKAQKQAYDVSVLNDGISAKIKTALEKSDDGEAVSESLNDAYGLSYQMYRRQGQDDETALYSARQFMSASVKEIVMANLKDRNTARAEALTKEYKDWLTPKDLAAIAERTRTVQDIDAGEKFGSQIYSNWAYFQQIKLTGVHGDVLSAPVKAMLYVESNGRDLDDEGNIIISKKGALGASQVMPKTLKEGDKGLGVEGINPKCFEGLDENNPDPKALFANMEKVYGSKENALAEINRLGAEYYNALVKRYGGDYVRAYAAYHSGYHLVDNPDWQNRLGKEGGLAVSKFAGALRGFSPAPTASNIEEIARANGMSDTAIKAATSKTGQLVSDHHRIETENQKNLYISAVTAIDDGKTKQDLIADGTWELLDPEYQHRLSNYISVKAGGNIAVTEENTKIYDELLGDPDKLVKTNINELKGILSRVQIRNLTTKQTLLLKPYGKSIFSELDDVLKSEARALGWDYDKMKNDPGYAERFQDMDEYILRRIGYELSKKGSGRKRLEYSELRKIVLDAIGEHGFFGFRTRRGEDYSKYKRNGFAKTFRIREFSERVKRDPYLSQWAKEEGEHDPISFLLATEE